MTFFSWKELGVCAAGAAQIRKTHLLSLGTVDFPEITPETFPLPTLGSFFEDLGEELLHGRGFLLLRGLPRERYSLDDIGLIYYGLGVHLGRPVAQSYQGELLGNVIDVSDVEVQARGYHAGGGQRMHSDNCDVVSLMCVQAARSGGISRIVSAAAVHNRLLETQPDLVEALYKEWVFRRMALDAQYGTGPMTKRVVIFSRESGQLTCNVSGSYPYRAVKAGDAVMTPTQIEALDEMARIAASPELYLDMSIGEGDIQFLQSHDHARPHRLRGPAGHRAAPPHAEAVAADADLARVAGQSGHAEPRRLPAVAAPTHFIHGGPDPLSRRDDAAQGQSRRLGLPR